MIGDSIQFRGARFLDLSQIITLLADDPLGSSRECTDPDDFGIYEDAFQEIDQDPNQEILVAEDSGTILGVVQISYLRHLSRRGARRAQLEGVRVSRSARGQGLGKKLIQEAISRAKSRECEIVQLTSDKTREEAVHFYQSLGFIASHEGFKLQLNPSAA